MSIIHYGSLVWVAVILGVLYGVVLGLAGYYLDRNYFRRSALGKIIVLKTLISLGILVLVLASFKFPLVELVNSVEQPQQQTFEILNFCSRQG